MLGETIHLTVIGDSEEWWGSSIFGRLVYEAALTETVTSSQTQHTSFSGGLPWTTGTLVTGDGFADVFNQIGGNHRPVDQLQIATVTLVKEAAGLVHVTWVHAGNFGLNFFGLTNAPGITLFDVPEPVTGALLLLGLVTLAMARRRRA